MEGELSGVLRAGRGVLEVVEMLGVVSGLAEGLNCWWTLSEL